MKRTFLAVETVVGDEFIRLISTFRSVLGSARISWVNPSGLHLTIAFLGDTYEDKIPQIEDLIRRGISDSGSFNIKLSGAGLFRDLRDPRVIWIGVEENKKLTRLASQVNTQLYSGGFLPSAGKFSPHITIGRVRYLKDTEGLMELLKLYRHEPAMDLTVNELVLFESILRPEGPLYKPLLKFPL